MNFVQKKVDTFLESTLPSRLNQDIAQFGTSKVIDGVGLDFSLMSKPVISDRIEFRLNATFFKVNGEERIYAVPAEGMSQQKLSMEPITDLEVRLTPDSVQSFFDAIDGHRINYTEIYYALNPCKTCTFDSNDIASIPNFGKFGGLTPHLVDFNFWLNKGKLKVTEDHFTWTGDLKWWIWDATMNQLGEEATFHNL